MTFCEYLNKWIANLTPEKRARWDNPTSNSVAFSARQFVIEDIREEYNTGKVCPIMKVK